MKAFLLKQKSQCSSCLLKSKKQELKNYIPISFRPASGKIFERLLYNSMFRFFTTKRLIFHNQSGFKPGEKGTKQLLSITHDICKSFDDGQEVCLTFSTS